MASKLIDLGIQSLNMELRDLGLALSQEQAEYGPHSCWLRPSKAGQSIGAYVIAYGGEFNPNSRDVMVYSGPLDIIDSLIEFAKKHDISFRYTTSDEPMGDKVTINRDGTESTEPFQRGLGLYRQMLLEPK